MASPQPARVLRCCSCRLFQAHQVKKSLKWTCKACGEKQSFLRAYGEGSGADCRHHVQKLNLLQGQISEMSLRSLEEPASASEGENTGPAQAENGILQEKSQPSGNRWLKYLEKDSQELELGGGGVCFSRQPSSQTEEPDPPFSQGLPRKRRWSHGTVHPAHGLVVQDSGHSEDTLQPQKGYAGLTRKVKQGSSHCLQENSADCNTGELSVPWRKLPSPARQVKATYSKWARFLSSPGNSSHVDTELPRPLQRSPTPASPAQAQQGTPRAQTPRVGHPSRPTATVQLPQATHTLTLRSERSCSKTPKQSRGTGPPWAEGGSLVQVAQKPPPSHFELHEEAETEKRSI
ncbi:PREDICTED: LOW QUALITY PROTEIN: UPF0544 protein C5orf45-like [Galeopterus variegatus]|uniref:LOW QUALITY PROTEIN: UPF0544 protein C5orf45-like n=1 Tax=Galeopterus variegatus TaxID=482537 RepID=A0ABM0RRG5_GALVR|nr:PREDICTED: LOW QUALITY PROTEIN: UPF0544 protein C5orf45-like [Galeopterus variegatus]